MMKLTAAFAFVLAPLMFAEDSPAVWSEASGLRLIAYRQYVILSPKVESDRASPKTAVARVEISALLENCGTSDVTVPTRTRDGYIGGSLGRDTRITAFDFDIQEAHGRKIVESAAAYQPVTLAPGEVAELPIYRETVTSESAEKRIQDYVRFSVAKELADRYGWWNGDLISPAKDSQTEPNQSSQRNAMARPISVFESRSSRG